MEMHPYYTEIPQRSFDAIVKNGYFSEVLMALLVDPLKAKDEAWSIYRISDLRVELDRNGHIVIAPINISDFARLGTLSMSKLKTTISQWVMERGGDAYKSLRLLTEWDHCLGVWCACFVAENALRYLPDSDERLWLAVETTKAWVRGMAAADDVRSSALEAYSVHFAADRPSAAYYAAHAVYAAAVAVYTVYPPDSAGNTAFDAAAYNDDELIRLREVVANACLTFPG